MTATRLAATTLLTIVGLTSDITDVIAQTIVESDSPREVDLVLADEPLMRVGMLDGPVEYLFGNITGAVRLNDGSVVVADEQSHEVRMFDAGGGARVDQRTRRRGAGRLSGTLVAARVPGSDGHDLRLATQANHRTRLGRPRGWHTGAPQGWRTRSPWGTRMLAGRRPGVHRLAGQ